MKAILIYNYIYTLIILNKYMQSIQLFVIFEHIQKCVWFSRNLKSNHYIALIPKNWITPINYFLKYELYSNNTLLEHSCIDNKYYSNLFECEIDTSKINNILYYTYYNYFYKNKLTIFYLNTIYKNINSIDTIFNNANWLERESSEMYGINFNWKIDTRRLLLDYSKTENPLKKEFQEINFNAVFFNIFENQIDSNTNEINEL